MDHNIMVVASRIQFEKVYPVEKTNSTISVSVPYKPSFEVPNRPWNPSKSKITFDWSVAAQAGYCWAFADTLGMIDEVSLRGVISGKEFARAEQVGKLLKMTRKRFTSLQTFASKTQADGLVKTDLAPSLNYSPGPQYQNAASPSCQSGSDERKLEPQYMKVSAASAAQYPVAAGAEHLELSLGDLWGTLFSVNKVWHFGEPMIISLTMIGNKAAFSGTSQVNPVVGATVLASTHTVDNLTLNVAYERRTRYRKSDA